MQRWMDVVPARRWARSRMCPSNNRTRLVLYNTGSDLVTLESYRVLAAPLQYLDVTTRTTCRSDPWSFFFKSTTCARVIYTNNDRPVGYTRTEIHDSVLSGDQGAVLAFRQVGLLPWSYTPTSMYTTASRINLSFFCPFPFTHSVLLNGECATPYFWQAPLNSRHVGRSSNRELHLDGRTVIVHAVHVRILKRS